MDPLKCQRRGRSAIESKTRLRQARWDLPPGVEGGQRIALRRGSGPGRSSRTPKPRLKSVAVPLVHDLGGCNVVADTARRHAAVQVVQRALGRVPDGLAVSEDEAVAVRLPAVDGRGPFRPDEATRKVRIPVGGAEVDRTRVFVQENSCGDRLAGVDEGDVKRMVVHW